MRARSKILLCVMIGAVALFMTFLQSSANAEDADPGSTVATVNGTIITKADFDKEIGRTLRYSGVGTNISDAQLADLKKAVLENLIARELLYQKSQAEGIEVDESMLDEHIASLKGEFPSEDEFNARLAEMNLTEESLRDDFKRAKALETLINEKIVNRIQVTDEETKEYYDSHVDEFKLPERVRASHILLKVDPQADDSEKASKLAQIKEIQKKLKQGEDFAALATKFSECPSAPNGGDLGYFGRGQMVKPFEDAAFALEPGQVSDIVETNFGYHLIKTVDHKPEGVVEYEQVKEKIAEHLKQRKLQDEMIRYIEELKEKAKISRNMPG